MGPSLWDDIRQMRSQKFVHLTSYLCYYYVSLIPLRYLKIESLFNTYAMLLNAPKYRVCDLFPKISVWKETYSMG